MESTYIKALEMRARWLAWAKNQAEEFWGKRMKIPSDDFMYALPSYIRVLEGGDTFFMNRKFASLVDHARQTIPDNLAFESEWLQSKQGWMWIEDPFSVPTLMIENPDTDKSLEEYKRLDLTGKMTPKEFLDKMNPQLKVRDAGKETKLGGIQVRISAVGWFSVPEGTEIGVPGGVRKAGPGTTAFLCFQDFAEHVRTADGFGCWSYFTLQEGDKVIDRIREFEDRAVTDGGAYSKSRASDMLHEIRWIYAGIYLMAQKLAVTFHKDTDRHTKRRAERERRPVTPFLRVISLRKLEEDKKRDKNLTPAEIEYRWQWMVRGHWRNQYYPGTDEHKPVFVEAYIKGPDDKPFKPEGHKIFVARR